MKHIKIMLLAMLMTVFGSHAAMANSANDSLAYAFGNSADMSQIELLTPQEMDSTKGDWWRASIRYDRKPHRFTSRWGPLRGNRAHFQVNVWKHGVKGSGFSQRFPAGPRIQWGSHRP